MWKELPELLREFLEIEFVNVERIGALRAARLGVIQPVGRGDNQLPGGSQHPPDFLQKVPPLFQVLDDFECDHQVEGAVGVRQLGARRLFERDIVQPVVGARVFHGFGRDIDARDAFRHIGQFRGPVAGAAPRIQNALAAGQPHREVVARHVLVEQVDIDLAGDQALARELSQDDSPIGAPCGSAR